MGWRTGRIYIKKNHLLYIVAARVPWSFTIVFLEPKQLMIC